ncbi:MAG: hypothetical protein KAR45_00495 [Desulfobacteraceae bacterium]|nr:hypothetical protein [Desulfobacteraceae bacterium]
MVQDKNMLAEAGIRFFGKISASATHEIKNTLAIINENAGLLEDLSMISHNEHSLSCERVNDISQKMAKQVQRADLILKRMNRFAHSVDLTTQVADLEEIVCFVLDLSARIVEQQEVIIEVTSSELPMIVDTNMFYLENIIWRAIEAACLAVKGEKKIIISFGNDPTTPLIRFSISTIKDNLTNNSMDDLLFGSKQDHALMAYLGISIEKNIENNSFNLLWPKRI